MISENINNDIGEIVIGIDIGSTTVKAVVCDPADLRILWQDYRRHETQQAEFVLDFLLRIGEAFPDAHNIRIFCTGSGSGPLAAPLGAQFVQEVNAVTMAVEKLHPEVNSVIELGGQDAKIIMFRQQATEDGRIEKQSILSMNDKCASGTGTTIDKCMIKLGLQEKELSNLAFDATRLHHVSAKCGVFAETDVVNLIKSGIPATEIMNSLADAIVQQNLAVLTRGNTLHHKVLLLGGPNTYLPFLVECWRYRIPEVWQSRSYDYPSQVAPQELIFIPDNAQYYAAFGAVVFGLADVNDLSENEIKGVYKGLDGLKSYINQGRSVRLASSTSAPLIKDKSELESFVAQYTIPTFHPKTFLIGQTVQGVIGLDGGSTSSKAVLLDYNSGEILYKSYTLSKGNPIQDTKDILRDIHGYVEQQGASLECMGFGATGYAANVLEELVKADVNIVETVAHMMAAVRYVPNADVICDIGGQDIKVLFLSENKQGERDVRDFRLSNQCSAGNGMLLQAMASQFGVALENYADKAFSAALAPKFSYGCAVFLDADRVNFQKESFKAAEMLAGLAQVLPKNIWQYVVQVPRLAEFGRVFVLQGGTQRNLAAVKAQVDYIKQRVPDADVIVHPHSGEAGAIGAALETMRIIKRRGYSTFIGMKRAIDLQYTSRNDESTICRFCPNLCSRTFIDSVTPDGHRSRYISGFSCSHGTVEDKQALKLLAREQSKTRKQFPNLVEQEANLAFRAVYRPQPLPAAGSVNGENNSMHRLPLMKVLKKTFSSGFSRSNADLQEIKIGMPRVLNMYSVAPFFSAYFETLGIPKSNLIWSPETSEKLWKEGGRYGSIDPCFPSKVIQAHIHELLFHAHSDVKKRRGPLNYIYYPCITHVPTWVTNSMDSASCPIVAGSPNVVKAAFTKEVDFFQQANLEYIDDSITFSEQNLLKRQLYQTWGERLGITEDENNWAVEQGYFALQAFDQHMQALGRDIIEQIERDHRIAILLIGRPYHNDPGLNHGILEEFQTLGYPVLSMRSIPKDATILQRYFSGADPLDIGDVWPENYSANSAQKVWAARFAAHHPNIAVLDLSSFKCGHDAPTYGIINRIVAKSKIPYSALHDIDANKPSGSNQIRVKTYAYKLRRIEEELNDQAKLREQLNQRILEKRRELEQQVKFKHTAESV